ncbi:MAG: anaerobic ribonucleoside-triphosphate reductase activating protein [Patescibacteria group bacterium]|nr:anaerobic ribonucleoside-triphosphate reductase activating protein [Patescibacteria group bacterium]MDD5164761.1 anaerobic ribonucleoside-triphosphate reductase activating protein [Patescibacteria group bacterium]MDD5534423.1 anaerobic ribonucleoside-triphosphate reductase activating protein [Patescibacteria group bacterium]
MIFKGWRKESFIEWPGKITTVVFVGGCNFCCPFCYNRTLVLHPQELPDIDEKEVLQYLEENKKMIEGVVITGGEPLTSFNLKSPLIEFIKKVKELELVVGIETNGTNPAAIEYLIKNKLIDYIAMDIKAPLESKKYQQLSQKSVNLGNIKKSIKMIIASKLDYEFRTTVVPGLLNQDDILKIAKQIKGAKKYALNQFNPKDVIDKKTGLIKPYSKKWFNETAKKIKPYCLQIEARI